MSTHYIDGRRVTVEYAPPPIPLREFDFCAYFSANDIGDPQGYGATEQAALEDLMDKVSGDQA